MGSFLIEKWKRVPLPSAEVNWIVPPMASMYALQIDKPSPGPSVNVLAL